MSIGPESSSWRENEQTQLRVEYFDNEKEALQQLYNATNGPGWEVEKDWTDTHIGEWSGVTTNDAGHIIELCLSDVRMDGQIPEGLADLRYLEKLELNNNRLWGPIPDGLGKLECLKYINLSTNDLTGYIPDLHALSELETLDLSYNRLTDAIPRSISNLKQLMTLDLADNRLSNVVPPLGLLVKLQVLDLSYNCLSGPIPDIWTLTYLKRLDLSHNEFSGLIDPRIGNLNGLKVFNLASNKLSGSIPRELVNLINLDHVDVLRGNRFDNSMPPELSDRRLMAERRALISLYRATDGENWRSENIEEDEVGLTGEWWDIEEGETSSTDNAEGPNGALETEWCVVAPVGSWYGVTTNEDDFVEKLHLPYNQLSGTLPPEFFDLVHLTYLNLRGNQLRGRLPTMIGNLSELKTLDLGKNELSGDIPEDLFVYLMRLQKLYLDCNNLEGGLSSKVERLFGLKHLDLSFNPLGGNIPDELTTLSDLERLSLRQCHLEGEIPSQLFDRLHYVDLSHNKLIGSIPSPSVDLTQCRLEYLNLSANNLSGEIPSDLLNCPWEPKTPDHDYYYNRDVLDSYSATVAFQPMWPGMAQHVDLSYNHLEGEIPPQLMVKSLRFLALNNNYKLRGHIPSEIGISTYLKYLNVSHNSLSGDLPTQLPELVDLLDGELTFLMLSNNNFVGRFFEALSELSPMTRRYLDCLDLSHNEFSGAILSLFTDDWYPVRHLDLSDNQFEGELPSDLLYRFNTMMDCHLNLRKNQLYGSILYHVGRTSRHNSPTFDFLDLTDNDLDGLVLGSQFDVLTEFCQLYRDSPNVEFESIIGQLGTTDDLKELMPLLSRAWADLEEEGTVDWDVIAEEVGSDLFD